MGQKACDKCSELVDEAKAFCPACGNAFVEEEQRQDTTAFEQMDNTIQMGNTMYGQMLSDMGLNISRTPEAIKEEIRAEILKPIAPAPPTQEQAAPAAKKNYLMWIIIGAAAAILLLALLVVVIAVVFLYLNRIT